MCKTTHVRVYMHYVHWFVGKVYYESCVYFGVCCLGSCLVCVCLCRVSLSGRDVTSEFGSSWCAEESFL